MVAIDFENISKQYRLGLVSTRTLSHDLNRWWQMNILGKEDPYLKVGEVNDRSSKGESEYVWALKDINFKVEQGDVLGIIGKNGAGKSTLLKILSKVTSPTTGTIKARGRIASLLEVGTGFHPEMTGRENIYMNGAIMGMTKAEITRKLDEIVDFAGVERYIDTPVKRYSSGMTVRLGFAIAAHLEPEILVVDEVLAVGDAEFQKKAIGKMQDVSKGEGRTVLFVSHNMGAVKSLCKTGIVLNNGNIDYMGSINESVDYYINESYVENHQIYSSNLSESIGNDKIKVIQLKVEPEKGNVISVNSGIVFSMLFHNNVENIILDTTFELSTLDDIVLFHQAKVLSLNGDSKKGYYKVTFTIKPYILNVGIYKLKVIFGKSQRYVLWEKDNIINFELQDSYEREGYNMSIPPGLLRPKLDISYDFLGNYKNENI